MSSSQRAQIAPIPAARGRSSVIVTIACLTAGVGLAALAFAGGYHLSHRVNFAANSESQADSATVVADAAAITGSIHTSSFVDRYKPAVDAPLAQPPAVVLGGKVAWFDPVYSFGPPPANLIRPEPPVSIAAATPPAAVVEPAAQQAVKLPQPKPQALAALTPQQPPRDAAAVIAPAQPAKPDFRAAKPRGPLGHDALVRKARAVLLAQAKAGRPSWFDKFFGKQPEPAPVMAYASADTSDVTGSIAQPASDTHPLDRFTAVYDIVAKTVHMPDGSKLEAHSGLGPKMDKPAYAHVKMHGVTPPHIYDITPREALFHGVAALRLTPLGGASAIHNRTGLLAHSYMLGPGGDSNGCVSFKDYDRFLRAYRSGQVKRLVVVASMD
jgi:hypothetical protein